MTKQYVVYDWAGNLIKFYGESDSFEDAWGKVYENFDHLSDEDLEDQLGEFYVEVKK